MEWVRNVLLQEVTVKNWLSEVVEVSVLSPFMSGVPPTKIMPGEIQGVGTGAPVGAEVQAAFANGTVVWRSIVLGEVGDTCRQLEISSANDFAAFEKKKRELEQRSSILNQRDQDTSFRHVANIRQPPVMPLHNNATGKPIESYKLMDIPKDVMDRIRAFYRKHRSSDENYPSGATGINAHEVKPGMVSYDMDMQERDHIAFNFIRPLVEEWVGMPLEFTALYGIREYYRGSELRKHVDRVSTHVYSVIIQVDRKGLEKEWPLEVYDFDGSVKELEMGAGQLMFYQSAKLVHGRPKPLQGDVYANLFCHFRPRDKWEFRMEPGDQLHKDGKPFISYLTDEKG
jgi:hypothetical protein